MTRSACAALSRGKVAGADSCEMPVEVRNYQGRNDALETAVREIKKYVNMVGKGNACVRLCTCVRVVTAFYDDFNLRH